MIVPLGVTMMVSFWERAGLKFRPAFTLKAYETIIEGARLDVLIADRRALAVEATALSLLIAYPIAYVLARKASPAVARVMLLLFTVPFLINYVVRNVAWTGLLGRTGTINTFLLHAGIVDQPLDWLLYSNFSVFLGLISTYMPFMIFPLVPVASLPSTGNISRQAPIWVQAPSRRSSASPCPCRCPASSPPWSSASSAALAKAPFPSSWAASAMSCWATPSPAAWTC